MSMMHFIVFTTMLFYPHMKQYNWDIKNVSNTSMAVLSLICVFNTLVFFVSYTHFQKQIIV